MLLILFNQGAGAAPPPPPPPPPPNTWSAGGEGTGGGGTLPWGSRNRQRLPPTRWNEAYDPFKTVITCRLSTTEQSDGVAVEAAVVHVDQFRPAGVVPVRAGIMGAGIAPMQYLGAVEASFSLKESVDFVTVTIGVEIDTVAYDNDFLLNGP